MKRRAVIDKGVGETRVAVYEGAKLVEFHLERWSDKNRPKLDDVYAARIRSIDKSMGGAFLDLGQGAQALLRFTNASNAPRLTEGQLIEALITSESSEAGKVAAAKFISVSGAQKPGALKTQSITDRLEKRFNGRIKFDFAAVTRLYDSIQPVLALPGGGDVAFEQTRALLAVDVDKGSNSSGYEAGLLAAKLIPNQIRLRGLGGLIVIDFPNLRQKKHRDELISVLEKGFSDDPNIVKIAPISRFGCVELTRQKRSRSMDSQILDDKGDLSVESQAMIALQQLEREGRTSPGAKLELTVPASVYTWLQTDDIGWRKEMIVRLGARYTLKSGENLSIQADR